MSPQSFFKPGLLPRLWIALCLIACGVMQVLAIAPFDWWVLGPVSIALSLFVTKALAPDLTYPQKSGFLYGYLLGLGLFGAGASWIYVSIHTYGYASPLLSFVLTLAFVLFLSLFPALVFLFHFKLRTKNYLKNALIFLCLWILVDALRTEILTGFPWLFLGYGHLQSPLSGWVPVSGVYGITLITVATGAGMALLASAAPKKAKVTSTLILVVIWLSGPLLKQINWSEKQADNLSVALVQLNIPQELKWLPAQRRATLQLLDKLTQEYWQHDLIIWPETAIPLLYDQALPYVDKMSAQAKAHNTNIISGIPSREFDKNTGRQTVYNSITSFGDGSGIYHKQKLVPFGEYVPLQEILRGLIAFFDLPMSDFRKGPSNQPLLKSLRYQVAPFICYEVVYPDFVANNATEADYLLTISNDSWFGESLGPLQHLEMAQMRAAENARYMIRATNNGVSAIIDERGNILTRTEQFVQTVLESEIQIRSGRTPFSYIGSYPLFLICATFIFWVGLSATRKAKPPTPFN